LAKKDQSVAVDKRFFQYEKSPPPKKKFSYIILFFLHRNLLILIKILIPKVFCGEVKFILNFHLFNINIFQSLFLVLVAASLIARTYADVWMITNSTSVESAIIGRSITLFKENLARFAYAMPLVRRQK
jgi:hypothetical protein